MNTPTISLSAIAIEANKEHQLATDAACSALEHAAKCGDLLAQAKAKVGHGGYLPWLKANFAGSERTARNYIRLASNRQRVADLGCDSIRQAIEALTDHPEHDAEWAEAETEKIRAKMEEMIDGAIELTDVIKNTPHLREHIGEEKWEWAHYHIDVCRRIASPIDKIRVSAIMEMIAYVENERAASK